MNKKIEHIWSVLCSNSSVDIDTNSLSIFNVVEQLNIQSIPKVVSLHNNNSSPKEAGQESSVIPVTFEIVSLFQRQDPEADKLLNDAILALIDPRGKILKENNFQIVFPKGSKRLRFRTKLGGMPITISGEYRFILKVKTGKDFHEMSRLPLDVKIAAKI